MKQLLNLLKTNKFARLTLGATLGILLLIMILSPRPKPPSSSNNPSPSTTTVSPETYRPELKKLPQKTLNTASDYRATIIDSLPIYFENFHTTPGIDTTINIFVVDGDPAETVRFEIYGLSYLNKDPSPFTNPNVTAFQESFKKGLSLMQDKGIDPKKLIFLYSDVEYVRTTATDWINHLGLLQ